MEITVNWLVVLASFILITVVAAATLIFLLWLEPMWSKRREERRNAKHSTEY